VGDTIQVDGANFIGTCTVSFGGIPATPVTRVSDTQLTVSVPAGALSGTVAVTAAGVPSPDALAFTVIPPAPRVTTLVPNAARVGDTIQVDGANFIGTCTVSFGGIPAPSVTRVSDAQLSVAVPAGALSGTVAVTAAGVPSPDALAFTVIPPAPRVTALVPNSARVGDTIQVDGANFIGPCTVSFGGIPATPVTRVSDTQLTVAVPAGALLGTVAVAVAADGGASPDAQTFTVIPPAPGVTTLVPNAGKVGDTIQVNGANFIGTCTLSFAGIPATTVTRVSDTQLTAVVPGGAVTGNLTVTTSGGTSAAQTFTVYPAPAVTGFTPPLAKVGDAITIDGTDFMTGATVTFAGSATPQAATVLSATQLQVAVPADAVSGPFQVVTPGGSASSPSALAVFKVATPLPSSAAPWQTVRILGSGFSTAGLAVQVGAFGAVSTTVVSDSELQFTVGYWGAGAAAIQLQIGGNTLSTPFTVLPPRDAMFTQALVPVVNPNPQGLTPADGRFLDFPAARRTQQYADAFLPQAPVFHGYNLGEGFRFTLTDVRNFSRFLLNFRLPGAFLEALPTAIQAKVTDVDTDDLSILFVSQDQVDPPGTLEFRAHYIVDPNAPTADPSYVDLNVNAEVTFVGADPLVTITGAAGATPQGPLSGSVYLHKADAAGTVVSSPDNFQVPALTDTVGRSFWSLTRWTGRGGRKKAAATLHWLLTDAEEAALEAVTSDTSAAGGPLPVATVKELMTALLTSPVLATTQGVQNLMSLSRPILRRGFTSFADQVLLGSGFTGATALVVDGGAVPIPLAAMANEHEIRMFTTVIPAGTHSVVVRTPLGDSDPVQCTF
jgi:hypothetical protein